MPFPIRRSTPQHRFKTVPPQAVHPAPLAAPQAPGIHVPVPLRRSTQRILRSRLVTPAPLAAPQASGVVVPLPPLRRSTRQILRSRLITAAPLASPQAPSTRIVGVKRGPTKPLKSRLVSPSPLAAPQAPGVLVPSPLRRSTRQILRSRLVTAAPLASPQAPGVRIASPQRRSTRAILRSRTVVPAPAPVIVVPTATLPLVVPRHPLIRRAQSRLVVAQPLASPQAPGVLVAGVKRPPTKLYRPRLVVPAPVVVASPVPTLPTIVPRHPIAKRAQSRRIAPSPLAAPQAPATFAGHGVKRGPTKPILSRLVRPAVPPPVSLVPTLPTIVPRHPIAKRALSRRILVAALAAPQAPALFAHQGVRRGPTKKAQSRMVVAATAPPPLVNPPAFWVGSPVSMPVGQAGTIPIGNEIPGQVGQSVRLPVGNPVNLPHG